MSSRSDTGAYFRRHLDGWQAAVVAALIVTLAATLVVPRSGARVDLPLPSVDRQAQIRAVERMRELAGRAHGQPLPYDARAVGEQVRRVGAMSQPTIGSEDSVAELRRAVRSARQQGGDASLLVLRAVQTVLFLDAVDRWLAAGKVDHDLIELAGNFADVATTRGWVVGRRLVVSHEDLASLYVVRWTALSGLLDAAPFTPMLDDWRVYFRLRMGYPDLASGRQNLRELSGDIAGLFKKDSEYPVWLARGVLAYHLQRYDDAAEAFRRHLTLHPYGPWTLRARNYLAEALQNASPAL